MIMPSWNIRGLNSRGKQETSSGTTEKIQTIDYVVPGNKNLRREDGGNFK